MRLRPGGNGAPASESSSDDGAKSNEGRTPMAVDFWGGVAAPEELVPFPGQSTAEHEAGRRSGPGPGALAGERIRDAALGRARGRRAAVGVAILFLGLVALRTLGGESTRAHSGARSDTIAQVGDPVTPARLSGRASCAGREAAAPERSCDCAAASRLGPEPACGVSASSSDPELFP